MYWSSQNNIRIRHVLARPLFARSSVAALIKYRLRGATLCPKAGRRESPWGYWLNFVFRLPSHVFWSQYKNMCPNTVTRVREVFPTMQCLRQSLKALGDPQRRFCILSAHLHTKNIKPLTEHFRGVKRLENQTTVKCLTFNQVVGGSIPPWLMKFWVETPFSSHFFLPFFVSKYGRLSRLGYVYSATVVQDGCKTQKPPPSVGDPGGSTDPIGGESFSCL